MVSRKNSFLCFSDWWQILDLSCPTSSARFEKSDRMRIHIIDFYMSSPQLQYWHTVFLSPIMGKPKNTRRLTVSTVKCKCSYHSIKTWFDSSFAIFHFNLFPKDAHSICHVLGCSQSPPSIRTLSKVMCTPDKHKCQNIKIHSQKQRSDLQKGTL